MSPLGKNHVIIVFFGTLIVLLSSAGCIQQQPPETPPPPLDLPASNPGLPRMSLLPNWTDSDYHDYPKTVQTISDFVARYPSLATQYSIGTSVMGRNLFCLKITNRQNASRKYACLIDGCIHGNEWEGGEACLYLADYLLINFGTNTSVSRILNTTEIYLVPLVNPDGRELDQRWNANDIDLNRNFDVNFGKISGRSLPIGKLFGFIKIPRIGKLTNSGRHAFSEPESEAMSQLMKIIYTNHLFSFYLACHTAQHLLIHPWTIYKPPFALTPQQQAVFAAVDTWVNTNTEYPPFTGKNVYTSGDAMNYCFKEFRVPSFTLELLSRDLEPMYGHGVHTHLEHWMETALPVFLYLLDNIGNLHEWSEPTVQPALPPGVPPAPLTG